MIAELTQEVTMPPKYEQIEPHHKQVAHLIIMGKSINEIAETVGLTRQTIHYLRNSPTFEKYLEKVTKRVEDDFVRQARSKIFKEAMPTIEKLVRLRDYAAYEHIQLGAAKELKDLFHEQFFPKRIYEEKKVVKIVLSGEDVKNMREAIEEEDEELKAIDVTPEQSDG